MSTPQSSAMPLALHLWCRLVGSPSVKCVHAPLYLTRLAFEPGADGLYGATSERADPSEFEPRDGDAERDCEREGYGLESRLVRVPVADATPGTESMRFSELKPAASRQ